PVDHLVDATAHLAGAVAEHVDTAVELPEAVGELLATVASLPEAVGELTGTVVELGAALRQLPDPAVEHRQRQSGPLQVAPRLVDAVRRGTRLFHDGRDRRLGAVEPGEDRTRAHEEQSGHSEKQGEKT